MGHKEKFFSSTKALPGDRDGQKFPQQKMLSEKPNAPLFNCLFWAVLTRRHAKKLFRSKKRYKNEADVGNAYRIGKQLLANLARIRKHGNWKKSTTTTSSTRLAGKNYLNNQFSHIQLEGCGFSPFKLRNARPHVVTCVHRAFLSFVRLFFPLQWEHRRSRGRVR